MVPLCIPSRQHNIFELVLYDNAHTKSWYKSVFSATTGATKRHHWAIGWMVTQNLFIFPDWSTVLFWYFINQNMTVDQTNMIIGCLSIQIQINAVVLFWYHLVPSYCLNLSWLPTIWPSGVCSGTKMFWFFLPHLLFTMLYELFCIRGYTTSMHSLG